MRELQKRIIDEFDAMIQDLVEELREADEKGEGVDLTELFGKQSTHYKQINQAFAEARERNPKAKW